MRSILKRILEVALTASGIASVSRRLATGRRLVLSYHNIVPTGDPPTGDSSLHLPFREFQTQLDLLEACFEVVPLADLVNAGPESKRNLAALTFDDGYRGALDLGFGEIVRRGLPATVFVCPAILDSAGFWWDRLAKAETGAIPGNLRSFALDQLRGEQEQVLAWAEDQGTELQSLPDLYRPGSVEELAEVAALPGCSISSHSWSHPNLSSLSPERLREEIEAPRKWMNGLGFGEPRFLSFPYGLWSEEVLGASSEAGIEAAFLVTGGLTGAQALSERPLAIPRMNIPRGLSSAGFLARISGVWPR